MLTLTSSIGGRRQQPRRAGSHQRRGRWRSTSAGQINWKEFGTFTKDDAVWYKLEYKDIPSTTWKSLVDASANTTPERHLRHGADMCGPADDPGHHRERRGRNLRVRRAWGERQTLLLRRASSAPDV